MNRRNEESGSVPRKARVLVAAGLLLALGTPGASVPGDLQRLLDARFPGDGVTRILTTDANQPAWAVLTGDVNGDGYGDLVLEVSVAVERVGPYPRKTAQAPVLLYGGPHLREAKDAGIDSLPQARFVNGDLFTGFAATWRDRPFSAVGDIDGDGLQDLGFSALSMDWQGVPDTGQVRILFGSRDFPAEVPLENPASVGVRSVRIVTAEADRKLGRGLERAGDLDGDGREDLVIQASARGSEDGLLNAGRVYIILDARALAGREEVDITEVGREVRGAVIHGAQGHPNGERVGAVGDNLGYDRSLEPGGDLNADGIDDLLMAAPFASRGLDRNGCVYILFGRRDLGGDLFAARPEEIGVEIVGLQVVGTFGRSLSSAGDVDGDGIGDFIVGESEGLTGNGFANIIFGRSDWPWGQVSLNAVRHAAIEGTLTLSAPHLGAWVDGPGDLNGDGFADLLISKHRESVRFGTGAGALILLHGGPELPVLAPDTAIGTPDLPGLKIQGRGSFYQLGEGGAAGGDLDGDGIGDIVVASAYRSLDMGPPEVGEIYLLFGGAWDQAGERLTLGAVEPAEGSLEGGTRVLLGGSGFEEGMRVLFGGVEAAEVVVATTVEAEAVVPPGEALGEVGVEVVSGARRASLERAFRYVEPPGHPDLVLDPGRLAAAGHRTLVLEGVGHRVNSGDADGDGFSDMVILAFEGFDERSHVWLLRGRASWPERIGFEDMFDEATLIESEPDPGGFGRFVSLGGDFNGDGKGDIAIGATVDIPVTDPRTASGRAYVIVSEGGDWPSVVPLTDWLLEGKAFTFPHASCGHMTVATFSDPEGNGILATGNIFCRGLEAEVKLHRGPFEGEERSPAPLAVIRGDPSLPFINTSQGHTSFPVHFGNGLAPAGDLNGDGHEDLVVGAYGGPGDCYLVLLGPETLSFDGDVVDLMEAGLAVRVRRGASTDMGWIVSPAGDFNGDGLDDVILPSPGWHDLTGETFVVFGSRELGRSIREIDLLQKGPGYLRIVGEYPGDATGTSFGIGDWNGDGFDDVAVFGIFHRNKAPGERFYVVFGEREPPAEIRLRTLGHRGFRIRGASGRAFGGGRDNRPVAGGDFDGDGHADIAVHDYEIGKNTMREGQRITVIFGRQLAGGVFVRGRVNTDSAIDLSDAVAILGYLFLGSAGPACPDAADIDDSGELAITDAVYLLNHLFLGGRAPPAPYPDPGRDPTPDSVPCP